MKQLVFIWFVMIIVANLALMATNPAPPARPRAQPREAPKEVTMEKNKDQAVEVVYKDLIPVNDPYNHMIHWDTIGYITLALGLGVLGGRIWPYKKTA